MVAVFLSHSGKDKSFVRELADGLAGAFVSDCYASWAMVLCFR